MVKEPFNHETIQPFMFNYLKSSNFLLLIISIALFIIPFFWLKPGEMDLGGDSTRLYFYDPIAYLKSFSLYGVSPEGMGAVAPNYYFLPFLLMVAGLKLLVGSPTILIAIFNIFKLLGGFLAMYFVVLHVIPDSIRDPRSLDSGLRRNDKEERRNDRVERGFAKGEGLKFAAILAGLFYVLSPLTTGNWDKALTSHFQIVLNPLLFFLLLKFFTTANWRYIWTAFFVSILFAPNFGFTSTPPFFAFYPLALLFLALFLWITKSNKVSWKGIVMLPVIFVGLHAFHLVPQIVNLLEPGSFANTRVFDRASIAHEGIRYFYGILPLAKVSLNLLLPIINSFFQLSYGIVLMLIVVAFIRFKKKQSVFLLTGVFFLITLFLLSANITGVGVALYKTLFYIPGFSMFRNFIGQWNMIFAFFYALLFGQALVVLFQGKIEKKSYYIALALVVLFVLSSWDLISAPLNKPNSGSTVRTAITMDPTYEKTLDYIKNIPDEGKILMLPYSDSFYHVLAGKNGGAYVSSSTISYLTGKKSFSGYQIMTAPFSEQFFALAREKDTAGIEKLLTYLGIKYIFYNSDRRIYDTDFPASPYSYARQSLPNTQKEYKQFVASISGQKLFESGPYQLFSVKEGRALPLFYAAGKVEFYRGVNKDNLPDPSSYLDSVSFLDANQESSLYKNTVYLDKENCPKKLFSDCQKAVAYKDIPTITFTQIDPTKYKVKVEGAKKPYILLFGNAYQPSWKLIFSDKQIADEKHFVGNGYANAWFITPGDTDDVQDYELTIEMTGQRVFYVSLIISCIVSVLFAAWGFLLFFPKIIVGIIRQSHD